MYKLLAVGLLFLGISGNAQDKYFLDSVDKIIINTIINPAEQTDQEPVWAKIELQVWASHTETETDRALWIRIHQMLAIKRLMMPWLPKLRAINITLERLQLCLYFTGSTLPRAS